MKLPTNPLAGVDLQHIAAWTLGAGYLLNTAVLCLISLLQDGHANTSIVATLTDSQHYSILALAALAGVHVVSGWIQNALANSNQNQNQRQNDSGTGA